MKFERLLKVPRSGRTLHLVVNIPEPMTVETPAPKPKRRARVWAVLKVAGPSSVAIAAIIISILSLRNQSADTREQRQTDKAAVAAGQRKEAQQVSFLQIPIAKEPYNLLRVENFSVNPAYNVTFEVNAFSARSTKSKFTARSFTLWLGDVPACSSSTINISPAAIDAMHKTTDLSLRILHAHIFAVQVNFMSSPTATATTGSTFLTAVANRCSVRRICRTVPLVPPGSCTVGTGQLTAVVNLMEQGVAQVNMAHGERRPAFG